ncbi:DnaK suppressor protein [Amycolatopsis taiwanensis]|uniref:DnaK suppressor protein n=2 Tax=Amycolatopsis taiwanensis TaxID=342230 RepID=A0A9W6R7Z3_9PSEU|nr:DnaK suppressor protein [Amycolatopsis taiwanensis]
MPAHRYAVVEARLLAERAATVRRIDGLARQVEGIVESSAWATNDDEHDPEGATVAFERAQVQDLLRQARAELAEFDSAAGRLRAGTYGRCERCGGAIADGRLEALPATRTCIACAESRRR